jgi:hypothetical protein
VDPAGRDHYRKLFNEGPNHFERGAAGTDDDGGAEFDGRNAPLEQDGAHFLAAAKVRGKVLSGAEATEVDDAIDAGLAGGSSKSVGGATIFRFKGIFGAHGVNQIVGGVDAGEMSGERNGIENIAEGDFRIFAEAVLESFRMAGEATDAVASGFESWEETPADIAGGTGEQNQFGAVRLWHDADPLARCGAGAGWNAAPLGCLRKTENRAPAFNGETAPFI